MVKKNRTQKRRATNKSLVQTTLVDAQFSGDKNQEDVTLTSSQVQKDPVSAPRSSSLGKMPEFSVDDQNLIDESVPGEDSDDSDDDLSLREALKRSRIEIHGGASSSSPLKKRVKVASQAP